MDELQITTVYHEVEDEYVQVTNLIKPVIKLSRVFIKVEKERQNINFLEKRDVT